MAVEENNDNIVTKPLPFELQSNILSRLPIKPLVRFQCVCKRWCDEIKHPSFINSHHYHVSKAFIGNSLILFLCHSTPLCYPLCYNTAFVTHSHGDKNKKIFLSADFHSSKDGLKFDRLPNLFGSLDNFPFSVNYLVGCCNGLLLFQRQDFDHKMVHFSLYNPATTSNIKTLHHIVPNHIVTNPLRRFFSAGFGYDCTSDDYKILRLYESCDDNHHHPNTDSYLYSFKTDSWKIIQCPPSHFKTTIVFSNNALHWLTSNYSNNINRVDSIVSFELGNGECHVSSLPEEPPIPHWCYYSQWELVDLRGCLHLVRYDTPFPKKGRMHIWVMKGPYGLGSTRSWAKLVNNISFRSSVEMNYATLPPIPCAYSEDGRELLISPGKCLSSFTCCDVQNGELKTVAVQIADYPSDGMLVLLREDCDYRVMPWIGSLKQL